MENMRYSPEVVRDNSMPTDFDRREFMVAMAALMVRLPSIETEDHVEKAKEIAEKSAVGILIGNYFVCGCIVEFDGVKYIVSCQHGIDHMKDPKPEHLEISLNDNTVIEGKNLITKEGKDILIIEIDQEDVEGRGMTPLDEDLKNDDTVMLYQSGQRHDTRTIFGKREGKPRVVMTSVEDSRHVVGGGYSQKGARLHGTLNPGGSGSPTIAFRDGKPYYAGPFTMITYRFPSDHQKGGSKEDGEMEIDVDGYCVDVSEVKALIPQKQ